MLVSTTTYKKSDCSRFFARSLKNAILSEGRLLTVGLIRIELRDFHKKTRAACVILCVMISFLKTKTDVTYVKYKNVTWLTC